MVSSAPSPLLDQLGLETPRAKSLIVTVYGDALLPYGGQCWLGDLISLVEPLGLNERMTRTAVFRLVQDGVLEAERVGRRSRYTLTRSGRRQFDSAQARIYAADPPMRDGNWTLIALSEQINASQRDTMMRELGFQGFARLSNGLIGAARGDAAKAARGTLADLGIKDGVTVFLSTPDAESDLPRLAASAWPLEEIASEYTQFLKVFNPVRDQSFQNKDQDAFVLRTLLIHAYRRALLKDPALPDALLPPDWPGHPARRLASDLYLKLDESANTFLQEHLGPRPSESLVLRRFG